MYTIYYKAIPKNLVYIDVIYDKNNEISNIKYIPWQRVYIVYSGSQYFLRKYLTFNLRDDKIYFLYSD